MNLPLPPLREKRKKFDVPYVVNASVWLASDVAAETTTAVYIATRTSTTASSTTKPTPRPRSGKRTLLLSARRSTKYKKKNEKMESTPTTKRRRKTRKHFERKSAKMGAVWFWILWHPLPSSSLPIKLADRSTTLVTSFSSGPALTRLSLPFISPAINVN